MNLFLDFKAIYIFTSECILKIQDIFRLKKIIFTNGSINHSNILSLRNLDSFTIRRKHVKHLQGLDAIVWFVFIHNTKKIC